MPHTWIWSWGPGHTSTSSTLFYDFLLPQGASLHTYIMHCAVVCMQYTTTYVLHVHTYCAEHDVAVACPRSNVSKLLLLQCHAVL